MMESPAPNEANVEEMCVKSEHSLGLECVCIKSEPSCDDACVQDEPSCSEACVKDEPWSCSDACVKDEPSCSDACVKDEPSSPEAADTYGISEAAAAARLYADHVVKDELVLGPELVETRRVLCTVPASLSTAEMSAVVGRACSVRLEHMHVDLKHHTCRIGPHTYKLQLSLNSQRDTNTRKKTNIFNNKISWQTQQKEPRGRPKAYKCGQCSFTTARKASLVSHERKHFVKERLDCDRCGYIASDKALLQNHMSDHNRNRSYKYGRCMNTSFLKSKLLVHEENHTDKKPYKCGRCRYASAEKINLKIHEQIHTYWRKDIKMWLM